jgi:protocatechuate 3,4-dioxygenase alpha subunit
MAGDTPFQTLGPFFDFALVYPGGQRLVDTKTPGTRIVIDGSVVDGAGDPVPDALVEIWQADAVGRYHHPLDERTRADSEFDGFGRSGTDARGCFRFETVMPGPVPGPGATAQSPHVLVSVLGRGLLTRLVTRIYFEGDPTLADDAILRLVPEGRRQTLIARRTGDARYTFDIHLQGANETVFFDV